LADRRENGRSGNGVHSAAQPVPAVIPAKLRVPTTPALPRERLEARLATAWSHRLCLVMAPAGSGKTTLLARFASFAGVPTAWYRAEPFDTDEAAFLRHVEAALRGALPGLDGGWDRVEIAARALESWNGGEALLVVDDLEALEGTPAEVAFARFVEYAPPWLAVLAGSRVSPSVNLSRLRASGELLEVGPEDLRFRAWEIERLFMDVYREPIPPTDLTVLARRTGGWAAGLQLFHVATRGKSAEERRRILGGVGPSSRLVREYLAQNVLGALPQRLRTFLVETCPLGRLTPALCDSLLDRSDSAECLDELVRRQVFTSAADDDDRSFRYHDVFRWYLDRILVEQVGEVEARGRHARAGALLEASGAISEAFEAFCRAEDWAAVRRLLGHQGKRLADDGGPWLEMLPPAVLRHDPWLVLASARRARAEGRWSDALDAFDRAEHGFGSSDHAAICRNERLGLVAWLDPATRAPAGWGRVLRAGLVREPLAAIREASDLPAPTRQVVRGLLNLAAGDVRDARRDLAASADDPELEPGLAAGARIGEGVAALLAGDSAAAPIVERGIEAAEGAGMPWLARLGRVASLLATDPGTGDATGTDAVAGRFDGTADPWGEALAGLVEAWAGSDSSGSDEPGDRPGGADGNPGRLDAADRAAARFRQLGAGVLEAWARGLAALASAEQDGPDARDQAVGAEAFARTTATPGARLLAYAALARAEPDRSEEHALIVDAVQRETGLRPPRPGRSTTPAATEAQSATQARVDTANGAGPRVTVRTFGGLQLRIDDRPVALDRVRPRARTVLRFLALHAGTAVHREIICAAIWPEADPAAAARNLHVAISALRGLLVAAAGPDGSGIIAREGDAYRLAIEADGADLRVFDRAIADARDRRARGQPVTDRLEAAVGLHAKPLMPEEGPADWIVEAREQYRAQAVDAARWVAEAALLEDDLDRAVRACQAGLALDRYHDPLWRILIDARERAGDTGAASRDRRDYAALLTDLDVADPASVSAS